MLGTRFGKLVQLVEQSLAPSRHRLVTGHVSSQKKKAQTSPIQLIIVNRCRVAAQSLIAALGGENPRSLPVASLATSFSARPGPDAEVVAD